MRTNKTIQSGFWDLPESEILNHFADEAAEKCKTNPTPSAKAYALVTRWRADYGTQIQVSGTAMLALEQRIEDELKKAVQ